MFSRTTIAFFASSSMTASRSARARRSLFILAVRREDSSWNLLISLTCMAALCSLVFRPQPDLGPAADGLGAAGLILLCA